MTTTHTLEIYDPGIKGRREGPTGWFTSCRDLPSKDAARRLAESENLACKPGEERKFRIVTRIVTEEVEYL